MNPNSKKPVNEGHLIQNREDIYKEIEKQRERERESLPWYLVERNTSNLEETMERTIQCSHLDAHGLDS
jgi:hypothetical protein